MDAIDVSVIIINYNTCRLTCQCIASVLEKTTGITYEIIVVDNASTDESVTALKKEFPSVVLFENTINEGFGKANNTGARYAKGNFLFLLNSDTLLLNNAIKELFEAAVNNPGLNIGAACSNLYTENLQPAPSYFQYYPNLFNLLLYKTHLWSVMGHDIFNKTGELKNVSMIIGAHLFLSREVFTSLNGFDPEFFMYLEDADLCKRLKNKGYNLISVPQAKIIHYQGSSSVRGSKLIMEARSFIYFFKKHHSTAAVIFYKAIELFFACIKAIAFFTNPVRRSAYAGLIQFLLTGKAPTEPHQINKLHHSK